VDLILRCRPEYCGDAFDKTDAIGNTERRSPRVADQSTMPLAQAQERLPTSSMKGRTGSSMRTNAFVPCSTVVVDMPPRSPHPSHPASPRFCGGDKYGAEFAAMPFLMNICFYHAENVAGFHITVTPDFFPER
jgi:hypothetical protein